MNPRPLVVGFVCLLLAVLLAAPAGLSASVQEHLTVEHVDTVGKTMSHGDLVVLLQERVREADILLVVPDFILESERLRVETDRAEISVGAGLGTRFGVETETHWYDHARLHGTENRQDYRFSIWPLEEPVVLSAEDNLCMALSPAQQDVIERTSLVRQSRPTNTTQVDDAIHWNTCQRNTEVTIQGDFLLRLWEWDAELTHEEGTRTLESGRLDHDPVPEEADVSLVFGHAQEQFIYAFNATLSIPRLDENHVTYLKGPSVMAEGGYRLAGATGTFLGVTLDRQEVFLDGTELNVAVQGTNQNSPMTALVNGNVDRFEVEGEPLAVPEVTEDMPGAGWFAHPLVLLVVLVAASLASAGTVTWRTSPGVRVWVADPVGRRRHKMVQKAVSASITYNLDQPKMAYRWAKLALRFQPNHPEALASMGKALYKLKDYERALRYFEDAVFAMDEDCESLDLDPTTRAFWSVDAIRCLLRIRFDTEDTQEREILAEKILRHANMAFKADADVAETLLDQASLDDLWEPIRLRQQQGDRYGVHA